MKEARELIKKVFDNKYVNCGLRASIGIVLLLAGVGKIISGAQMVNVIASLKMLPYPMIQPTSMVLPWFEILLGTLFLLGIYSRVAAAASLLMFSAFIVTNIFNLHRGLTEPCASCFGNLLVLNARDALIIDVLLLLAAFRILSLEGHSISLDSLWVKKRHPA
jgi:uncharacterized membrane protein YphA (DoxX/SURF4 family)